jgi:broad specificity phosphatase PhoE
MTTVFLVRHAEHAFQDRKLLGRTDGPPFLARLRESHAGRMLVLVTHAEPIRAILLHAAGLSLNDFVRIDVPPGSVTRLGLERLAPEPIFSPKALCG